MLILDQLADQRINEAIENGELEELPGQGQPLVLEDLSHVPEELRMAFKIMKNAGIKPTALELRKEIFQLQQSLLDEVNTESSTRTLKKIQLLMIKLDMNYQYNSSIALQQAYQDKLISRFSHKS